MARSALLSAVAGVCSLAMAVSTSEWTHTTEADFSGKMEAVVASSLGDLRLSRATKKLIEQDPRFDVVYATKQLPDGSIVLGTGPGGLVMRLADGKLSELYKPKDAALASAIAVSADGKLLVGLSGEAAKLVQVDPASGQSKELFSSKEAQFVWAIQPMKDGSALLGTGPTGQLLQVMPDGKSKVVLATRQHNILSILPLAEDMAVIGTDPDGLIIRVNIQTGEWFVLYDANEPEITALVAGKDGSIYAAASSAVSTAETQPAGSESQGRPEAAPDLPLRRETPQTPQRPKKPDTEEQDALPKAVRPMHLAIDDVETEEGAAHAKPATQPTTAPSHPRQTGDVEENEAGSAIYRISAGGFVDEIFRRAATIHSMVMNGDDLIVGTGPEGYVYQVRPATQEFFVLAQAESRQISSMDVAKDGQVLMGTSNPGGLLQMAGGFAGKGMYTSEVLDAEQVAQFGMLQLQGTLPAGTTATVAMRSGNVKDPENGGWSKWSAELPAAEFVQIAAPAARFLQYRVTMTSKDGSATPIIEEIKLNYLLPNMPPKVAGVTIEDEAAEGANGEAAGSPTTRKISWEASDPNKDELRYTLHYRLGSKGKWILLKDDLKETEFSWKTRELADGRYEVRVTASDAKANTVGEGLTGTRFSEPVIVDNTPSVIGDMKSEVKDGQVTVSMRVVDRTSTVAGVQFTVDSTDDWQAAASSDMLYDSPDETVKFTTAKLAAGPHQVTIRARDSAGNAAYETLLVTVEK